MVSDGLGRQPAQLSDKKHPGRSNSRAAVVLCCTALYKSLHCLYSNSMLHAGSGQQALAREQAQWDNTHSAAQGW